MNVELKFHTPLSIVINALNMSHDSHDKADKYELPTDSITDKDRKRLERVVNKMKHKSIAEMAVYWFDIDGISRACLQELARHRTARLTVKSSRYTLRQLRDCYVPTYSADMDIAIADLYVKTGNKTIDTISHDTLYDLCEAMQDGISNDIAKYCLPESFKTRLQWQIDGRNLQNFLELRTSKDALWEIHNLASAIYQSLPTDHQYLYTDYVQNSIQ